ncbi:hypothetical protein A1O3_02913 [Capronia epimyces CBS 606.96]|uniref:Short-chain dehydrogenase n=1 Tax=Capronia epimyces CBS 606.96 TaxID=1182542 RepID=W9YKW0_9EURO|nr:uncharacterized protein A1O3_02913 [Capronia epimyces CBS 606.96]EXJ89846.1 hypothetical protein A1O3_02913 [Capronia epimyces CBS 606.96]
MASSSPARVLLVLGAGPNIGAHLAQTFSAKGYQVALASRTPHPVEATSSKPASAYLHVTVDLSQSESVPGVFETVKAEIGAPSVVVYNAALRYPDTPDDPLSSLSLANFSTALAVNTTSAVAALQQAVQGFQSLPASPSSAFSKTFIFTGNILNVKHFPGMLAFGLGKAATAYAIQDLVEGKNAYRDQGIKFYYADERNPQGGPAGPNIDGPAAAIEYLKLAERQDQGPWLHTFIKGQGYKDFGGQ